MNELIRDMTALSPRPSTTRSDFRSSEVAQIRLRLVDKTTLHTTPFSTHAGSSGSGGSDLILRNHSVGLSISTATSAAAVVLASKALTSCSHLASKAFTSHSHLARKELTRPSQRQTHLGIQRHAAVEPRIYMLCLDCKLPTPKALSLLTSRFD
jgi:hypothetical protein